MKRCFSPNHLADLPLSGIKPPNLVNSPISIKTEPISLSLKPSYY